MIDYFHDLSVLRDGESINFQRASATLDGCVKIYSSRVDSAATETGRLISGLATRKRDQQEVNFDDNSEDEALTSAHRQKVHKSHNSKNTLLEFDQIKIKKMDLELYGDPLFKRALADFDEGGSKSLLLNMLNVDSRGKIVFDTTDSVKLTNDYDTADKPDELEPTDGKIIDDIKALGEKHLAGIFAASVTICPSVGQIRCVVDQKSTSGDLLKGLEDIELPEAPDYNVDHHHTTYQDFEISYGQTAELEPEQNNVTGVDKFPENRTSIFFDEGDNDFDDYGMSMQMLFDESKSYAREEDIMELEDPIINIPDDELLAYFDDNHRRNWTGPEHWKVKKIKQGLLRTESTTQHVPPTDTVRAKLHAFTIDFLSDHSPDQEKMFETAQGSSICIPKARWRSKDNNVLPDDRNFKTKDFITLFTKGTLLNMKFNHVRNIDNAIDESLYAECTQTKSRPTEINNPDFYNDNDAGFDDDYLQDDGLSAVPQILARNQTSQPLKYSRVSKKVDVKLLKDNMWSTLKSEILSSAPMPAETATISKTQELKFSQVVSDLGDKYDSNTKRDLSTSFCFICLLHLANENAFTITDNEDNSDLIIRDFPTPST